MKDMTDRRCELKKLKINLDNLKSEITKIISNKIKKDIHIYYYGDGYNGSSST